MKQQLIEKYLHTDESFIAMIRRSPWAFFGGWMMAIVFIIAAFFFLFPLFRLGQWGVVGFFVILGMGIVVLARTIVLFRYTVLVLTSERLIDIDQRGFLSREVSECPYEQVVEISYSEKGMLGMIAHIGDIVIHTESNRADIGITGVQHPQKVHELISRTKRKRLQKQDSSLVHG